MAIKTEPKALHLNHPTIGAPAMAAIVSHWYQNGRFVGYEVQFSGEDNTRHLRFAEIRELQGETVHD